MSIQFDQSSYYTRHQSDNRYQQVAPLSAPTAFTVTGTGITAGTSQQFAYLTFSSTPPTPGGIGNSIASYNLLWSYSNGGTTITQVTAFPSSGPFQLNGLQANILYTLQLQAVDAFGQPSAWTSAITATSGLDTTPPAAPTITGQLVTGGAQIQVTTLNTEPDFKYYALLRKEGSASTQSDGSDMTIIAHFVGDTFDDHSIATSDNYWYRVQAIDLSGNTSTSNQVGPYAITATELTPPAEPTLASLATPSDGSLILTWNTISGGTILQYRIWNRITGATLWTLVTSVQAASTSTQAYTDTDVINGSSYDYTVSAIDVEGDESSIGTTTLTAIPSDTTAPPAPSALSFTSGLGCVITAWPAVSDSTSQVLYGVSYRLNSGASWSTEELTASSSYTQFGFDQARDVLAGNLEFRVRSLDIYSNGSSYADAVVQFSDLLAYAPADDSIPPAPSFPSQVVKDDGSISITWPSVNIPDIEGYRIDRRINLAGTPGEWELLALLNDSTQGTKTYTDYGLEPYSYRSTTYDYAIYSIDTGGNISRLNLLLNSSFETGILEWTGSGTATSTSTLTGTGAAIVGNGASLIQVVAATAALPYSASAYFQQNSGGGTATLTLQFLDSGHSDVGSPQSVSLALGSNFSQAALPNVTAPSNTAYVQVTLATTSTQTAYVDDVQLEQAITVSPYGDGKLEGLAAVDNTLSVTVDSIPLTAAGVVGGIQLGWTNGTTPIYVDSKWIVLRSATFGGTYAPVLLVNGSNNGAPVSVEDNYQIVSTAESTFYYNFKLQDRWGNQSNAILSSSISATSLSEANDFAVPATPSGLTLGTTATLPVADGQLANQILTWTANHESDLDHYEIEYWPGSGSTPGTVVSTTQAGSDATTLTIGGLLPNSEYGYRIRAVDTWTNFSPWSAAVNGTTAKDTTAPSAPAAISATAGLRSITVVVTTPNTESDFDHYNWYRNTSNTFSGSSLIASGATYTDVAVTQGTAYYYFATAVDTSDNESEPSSSATATPGLILHTDVADGEIQTPALAADSVTTQKLSILNRTLMTQGITFTPVLSTNTISWTAGTLIYETTTYSGIVSGSAAYTSSPVWIYFDSAVSTTVLQSSTTAPTSSTATIIGLYNGGGNWSQNTGMTAIDGSFIQAGTVSAKQLDANGLTLGGGSDMPGTLTVVDGSGTTVGYIGQFSSTQLGGTTYGIWARTLGIGNTASLPFIYADNFGTIWAYDGLDYAELFAVVKGSATGTARNLVPDSDYKFNYTYWATAYGTAPVSAESLVASISGRAWKIYEPSSWGGSAYTYMASTSFPVYTGIVYTLSGYIDSTTGLGIGNWQVNYPGGSIITPAQASGTAGRVTASFTPTSTGTATAYAGFDSSTDPSPSGRWALFSAPQVELGDTPTAYRQNPMDDSTGSLKHGAMSSETQSVISGSGALSVNPSGGVTGQLPVVNHATSVQTAATAANAGLNSSGQVTVGTASTSVAALDSGVSRATTGLDSSGVVQVAVPYAMHDSAIRAVISSGAQVNVNPSGGVTGNLPLANHATSVQTATTAANAGLNSSGQLLTGTTSTTVADLNSAATKANTAIDSGNVVVAGSLDFSRSYTNKTASNIPYASGASLESLKPAQAGADVTASNPQAQAWLTDHTSIVNASDSITRLSGCDLSNIADNSGAARFAVLSVDANRRPLIDGASSHVNWSMDHIPDGSTRFGAIEVNADKTANHASIVTASNYATTPPVNSTSTYMEIDSLSVGFALASAGTILAIGNIGTSGNSVGINFKWYLDGAPVGPVISYSASDDPMVPVLALAVAAGTHTLAAYSAFGGGTWAGRSIQAVTIG